MVGRIITLAFGLTGAAGLSQFPEFSQQYLQRLSGNADRIAAVVEDFDRDAARRDLSRDGLVDRLAANPDTAPRAETMTRYFRLNEAIATQLETLRASSSYERLLAAPQIADTEIAEATLRDYKPALPLTPEGAVFAGVGFLAGWGLWSVIWTIFGWPVRAMRRRRYRDLRDHHGHAHAAGGQDHHHLGNPDLEGPVAEGDLDGIAGRPVPGLQLVATDGSVVDLSRLSGVNALVCLPLLGKPGAPFPHGWDGVGDGTDATAIALSFRDAYDMLLKKGLADVYGIGGQTTLEQKEASYRLALPFKLLADPGLEVAQALDLPRVRLGGQGYYGQSVLILKDGQVIDALYPVKDPSKGGAALLLRLSRPRRAKARA
ncbi:MAG: DUF2937 family protein [Shimia sp.]